MILLAAFLVVSCNYDFKELEIMDGSTESRYEIHLPGYPYKINLIIKGEIEGSASLSVKEINGDFEMNFNIENKIDTVLNRDWYDRDIEINYVPDTVVDGQILIKYRFPQ